MSKTMRKGKLAINKDDYHSPRFVVTTTESLSNKGGNKLFNRKMKPYIKIHSGMNDWGSNKFEIRNPFSPSLGTRVRSRTGFGARQSFRNANRSMKKGLRQQLKKQIQEELQLISLFK